MTLIEMLVVLTVMALLAAITALSTGIVGDQSSRARTQSERFAERLVQVFTQVELSAHVMGDVLAWFPGETGWQQWRPREATSGTHWQPWQDAPANIQIPDLVSIEVLSTAEPQPYIVFLPAQGVEPFDLIVRDRNTNEALARVRRDADAGLLWEPYP